MIYIYLYIYTQRIVEQIRFFFSFFRRTGSHPPKTEDVPILPRTSWETARRTLARRDHHDISHLKARL